jgi:hypothetical protein
MIEFFLHGGTLALAWFLLVNLGMSAALAAGAGWIIRRWTGADSASVWFAAASCRPRAALLFVGIVFVPSYWKYEPRDFVEGFDITLTALALARRAADHGHRPRR